MKILAITPFSSMIGGANRSFLMVLESLKRDFGHYISVIVPSYGQICNELDKINIDWTIIHFHEIYGVDGYDFSNYLRLIKRELQYIIDWHTANKTYTKFQTADIVYINDISPYFGAIIARKLNIPCVWHFRSFIGSSYKFIPSIRNVYGHARIIVISDCMKNYLTHNRFFNRDIIERIYNAIPLNSSDTKYINRINDRTNGFHLVICGRITEDKGQIQSILAINKLIHEGLTDVFLHIVGEDPSKDKAYLMKLKELSKKLNLCSNIIFEGSVSDMNLFRQKMHVELICSQHEPFGRVTIEGMRASLVVIGANCGATPEIIQHNNTGLLYSYGDIESLAECIKMVYFNNDLYEYLSYNGHNYACSNYLPTECVTHINNVLRGAV